MKIRLTGRPGNKALPIELIENGVNLVGYVDDVKKLIANSQVSVVPLLRGAGTRLKILEAL